MIKGEVCIPSTGLFFLEWSTKNEFYQIKNGRKGVFQKVKLF